MLTAMDVAYRSWTGKNAGVSVLSGGNAKAAQRERVA